MDAALTAGLDPLYRLVLSYAPAAHRLRYAALFALDSRLTRMVEQAREPLLGQMKLAWWRDELGRAPGGRAAGEPILAAVATGWHGAEPGLIALIDGWEARLGDGPLAASEIDAFAGGRASAFAVLATLMGEGGSIAAASRAARRHALVEFAAQTSIEAERQIAFELARGGGTAIELPRSLRPLAILDGLARRSLAKGGTPLLGDRMSALVAIRLGIFGR